MQVFHFFLLLDIETIYFTDMVQQIYMEVELNY